MLPLHLHFISAALYNIQYTYSLQWFAVVCRQQYSKTDGALAFAKLLINDWLFHFKSFFLSRNLLVLKFKVTGQVASIFVTWRDAWSCEVLRTECDKTECWNAHSDKTDLWKKIGTMTKRGYWKELAQARWSTFS